MKHPNMQLLEKLYSDLSEGNLAAVLSACADQVTFQIPGKSPAAGKFDKRSFESSHLAQSRQLEVHDILASDRHAAVLVTDRVARDGKTTELRGVHIWRFENGKPVAWYEYPRDLYQFDAIWG